MNRAAYVFLVLTVVLGASVAGFHFSQRHDASGTVRTDKRALEKLWSLDLPDTTGKRHRLSQWQGRVLVVNFWATWCPPCRREIPGFIRLSGKYASDNVQFVGIGVDDPDKVREFSGKMAIPYPILIGDMDLFRLSEDLGNPTQALPFTLIIDRQGKIAFIREGMLDEASLELILKPLVLTS
jgi:thiol-disulfide isomerase/thioredoxin